ncbi:ABC transporter ATP-binding protein [Elioraea thermophila]|uniref:ABC transporter ATP-binding protein n=1 Tax=Elioraea thermophila TaxID=2185104 RepID=UPI000DF42C48|nr:ABC transporter ATP-binding protein [Elioraea thermophila]
MSEPLLSARGLAIAFGGVRAADGVDLDVAEGEILAIIGPNGAGKTTFINMTTGYLRPQAGRILFGGEDITGLAPRAIVRRGIARSFQIPQLFAEQTVIENVALKVAARRGFWRAFTPLLDHTTASEAMRLLEQVGLAQLATARATELNEGARKLTDVAMAMALEPRLLLMDEPTSGVASAEKFAVMDTLVGALRARRTTAVFVEHDMEVVERYADRVAVWSQGKILVAGPPREVLADPAVLREVIGVETAHAGA